MMRMRRRTRRSRRWSQILSGTKGLGSYKEGGGGRGEEKEEKEAEEEEEEGGGGGGEGVGEEGGG